jgi:predicted TIM-barrel fold metal-dependent hydrolase
MMAIANLQYAWTLFTIPLTQGLRATLSAVQIAFTLFDDIGVETLMWGSDYPHPDGVWPDSSKYIADQFGHLPPDVVHAITCGNAQKFYGLAAA